MKMRYVGPARQGFKENEIYNVEIVAVTEGTKLRCEFRRQGEGTLYKTVSSLGALMKNWDKVGV